MNVEYDLAKDVANLEKHGVSLRFGERVLADAEVLIVETIRDGDEEERFKAIGRVDDRLWTAIHVYRGQTIRFISVRRSNAGEQRAYDSDPG